MLIMLRGIAYMSQVLLLFVCALLFGEVILFQVKIVLFYSKKKVGKYGKVADYCRHSRYPFSIHHPNLFLCLTA